MFANSTISDRYSNSPKRKHDKIEAAPDCPRCLSSNTKFCYFNNYNLSQPRYFCKACRRYWTKGGSLRNVPVGGGCRKSRRARQSASYTTPTLGTGSADESNGGACIDMAAVFAKYVKGHSEIEESYGAGDSSGSSENATTFDVDSRLEDVTTSFESKKPLDLINVGELSTFQQLVFQDCRLEMEVQGVLCDELSPDILWPEGTTLLPSFGFQELMVQGGDCGLFAPDDDQLRISESLVTDHWGYYDISEYDFY